MKPKILIDENIPFIKGRLEPYADVRYLDQFAFTPENTADADALLIRTRTRCDKSLLEGSKVRLVATATIGTDQIDMEWCAGAGIEVRNSPGCNAPGVAQYVWASLLRMVPDIRGKRVGVVGFGNVGSTVARWGERLGAEIMVCDPPRKEAGHTDTSYRPLEQLLSQCHIVTLHTPLTRSGSHPTFHMISDSRLLLMQPGAILVNAARGPVVDTEALKRRLRSGELRAVIDTWENEPQIDTELLRLAEVATFHIAGYSLEGKQRATRMVLEATDRVFGWHTDKSGLAPDRPANEPVTARAILDSYDPAPDMEALRKNPDAFDRLRHDYIFRKEPSFI